jgi:hypothetical protein
MTVAEYDDLLGTVQRMAKTADILSRTMAMFAKSEKDAARHAFLQRLHITLNDTATALRHTIDAAPVMVQP